MSSQTTDQTSRLLKLPLELRQTIYEFAFAKEVRINALGLSSSAAAALTKRRALCLPSTQPPHFGIKEKNIGLLFTCRQIHEEATKFYYRCTVLFSPASADALRIFLNSIPTLYHQEIRTIHVWMLFGLGPKRDGVIERRRKLKAKLINLEAELLYAGFSIPSGVLNAFARLTAPDGELTRHVWTSEPTDLELEEDR